MRRRWPRRAQGRLSPRPCGGNPRQLSFDQWSSASDFPHDAYEMQRSRPAGTERRALRFARYTAVLCSMCELDHTHAINTAFSRDQRSLALAPGRKCLFGEPEIVGQKVPRRPFHPVRQCRLLVAAAVEHADELALFSPDVL